MRPFDCHADLTSRATSIMKSYRNTQNACRFFIKECGAAFRFDRSFVAWLKDGAKKTMADEWLRRQAEERKASFS